MAFISEPHFSGLNWNPHPVQPRTDTFHLWAQLFGVELRHEVQPPTDGFHLWTSLFRGWTHAHTNQYGIWRQLASINLLSTKQTVGIQTETEPISGSFTLREPKRTQTNQRLTALEAFEKIPWLCFWGEVLLNNNNNNNHNNNHNSGDRSNSRSHNPFFVSFDTAGLECNDRMRRTDAMMGCHRRYVSVLKALLTTDAEDITCGQKRHTRNSGSTYLSERMPEQMLQVGQTFGTDATSSKTLLADDTALRRIVINITCGQKRHTRNSGSTYLSERMPEQMLQVGQTFGTDATSSKTLLADDTALRRIVIRTSKSAPQTTVLDLPIWAHAWTDATSWANFWNRCYKFEDTPCRRHCLA